MNTRQEREATIEKVERAEHRYNIVRLVLMLSIVVFITSYIAFQANHAIREVERDNQKTRQQIDCLVNGFLVPNQQEVASAVHACESSK